MKKNALSIFAVILTFILVLCIIPVMAADAEPDLVYEELSSGEVTAEEDTLLIDDIESIPADIPDLIPEQETAEEIPEAADEVQDTPVETEDLLPSAKETVPDITDEMPANEEITDEVPVDDTTDTDVLSDHPDNDTRADMTDIEPEEEDAGIEEVSDTEPETDSEEQEKNTVLELEGFSVNVDLFENGSLELDFSSQYQETSDSLLQGYFEEMLFGSLELASDVARSNLGPTDGAVYDYILNAMIEIAAGNRAYAVVNIPLSVLGIDPAAKISDSDLGLTEPVYSYVNGKLVYNASANEKAVAALKKMGELDWYNITNDLVYDRPYEQYWSTRHFYCYGDITVAFDSVSYDQEGDPVTTYYSITDSSLAVYIGVSKDFQGSRYYLVDTSKTKSASRAAVNAQKVVYAARNLSDYKKLCYYENYICSNTAYSLAARNAGEENYESSGPWQVINVFDNDTSTRVICEGYAKAFQYLCDLTVFDSPVVESILVYGPLEFTGGGYIHVWNIVTMPNGKNYLVDICHCDIRKGDYKLFLVGNTNTNIYDWFNYTVATGPARFKYDSDTLSAYSSDRLILSSTDYKECANESSHYYIGKVTKEATCTQPGIMTYYCYYCDSAYTEEIPVTDHRYGSWSVITAPGANTEGTEARCCEICGSSQTRSIPALSHVHNMTRTAGKNAGCTSPGNLEYWTCSTCGRSFLDETGKTSVEPENTAIPATGHNIKYIDAKDATTTSEGNIAYYRCENCQKLFSDKDGKNEISAESIVIARYADLKAPEYVNAKNLSNGIQVTWKQVDGADGYYLYRGYTFVADIKGGSVQTYTDTATTKNGTRYFYSVIPYAVENGKAMISPYYTSKAICRLQAPTVSTPVNSASGAMTVKWSKNAKATGYNIQYSLKSTFSSYSNAYITSAEKVSRVIRNLTKGKTYYVRVRSYKIVNGVTYTSGWSAVKKVKISY